LTELKSNEEIGKVTDDFYKTQNEELIKKISDIESENEIKKKKFDDIQKEYEQTNDMLEKFLSEI